MQSLDHFSEIYLHRDPVDMRKSINGLSLIVLEEIKASFTTERLFVFVSRCGKKLKIVYWDRSGFALWYKRLERQKFRWPRHHESEVIVSGAEQLRQLLFGFDVFQRPHDYLQYEQIG